MRIGLHLTGGMCLLLIGLSLMVYTVYALGPLPFVCLPVLAWLAFVEYAVARVWWTDLRETTAPGRRRRVHGRV
jgi:hypothetical protein